MVYVLIFREETDREFRIDPVDIIIGIYTKREDAVQQMRKMYNDDCQTYRKMYEDGKNHYDIEGASINEEEGIAKYETYMVWYCYRIINLPLDQEVKYKIAFS